MRGGGMEFRILGPLEVHDGSGPVRVPGAKERALLADLLVNAGRVVAADRLVEDLWGEEPPGNPANTLQGRVSALRRALGPAGAGLLLTNPPRVPAGRGARAVGRGPVPAAGCRGRRHRGHGWAAGGPAAGGGAGVVARGGARGLRRPAVGTDGGGPAGGAAPDRPGGARRAAPGRRRRRRVGGGAGDAGHRPPVAGAAARAADTGPVPLRQAGRRPAGVRRDRATLAEELGIDPSPELQRLQRAILTQDPAIGPPERARAPAAPPHNLPERLTSLVGWDRELDEVGKLVGQHRLVTVTGPGGAGKTSLAVEAARGRVAGFPDGVWLVELAALADPGLLAEVVAATLGLREEPGPPGTAAPPAAADRLAGFVRDKVLLVVLDNCEHLVAGCAELVVRLLRAAPGLRVLATSREVLGVPGELVRPVPPLAVPDPPPEPGPGDGRDGLGPEVLAGYDGVRLFLERAQLADPSFVLDRG